MGLSRKVSATLSIMFPVILSMAGGIVAIYASGSTPVVNPPEVRPDSVAPELVLSYAVAAADSAGTDSPDLTFKGVVDEVPEVDPVAWADTAIFRFRNPDAGSRYIRLTHEDYAAVAAELGVETAAIKAVVDIEAGPSHKGFWKPGKPIINFDLTMFRQFAKRRGVSLAKAAKSHPVIFNKPDRKRYGSYQGAQYARLEAACSISKALGIESTFWGMFQIGGFNWRKCGCNDIEEFMEIMSRSERDQLELFARFVESYGLIPAIRDHNWLAFALKYNGPKAKQRGYHTRMAAAYRKYAAAEKRMGKGGK